MGCHQATKHACQTGCNSLPKTRAQTAGRNMRHRPATAAPPFPTSGWERRRCPSYQQPPALQVRSRCGRSLLQQGTARPSNAAAKLPLLNKQGCLLCLLKCVVPHIFAKLLSVQRHACFTFNLDMCKGTEQCSRRLGRSTALRARAPAAGNPEGSRFRRQRRSQQCWAAWWL